MEAPGAQTYWVQGQNLTDLLTNGYSRCHKQSASFVCKFILHPILRVFLQLDTEGNLLISQ